MVEQVDRRCQTVERQTANNGLTPQLRMILEAFYRSRERPMLLWLGAGLVAVVAATAYGQIKLNAWNQPFYDALARKDLAGFGSQPVVSSTSLALC